MNCYCSPPAISLLDIFSNWANIIIAAAALIFTIYIFFFNNNREEEKNQKDRQSESLKTIILEHNLKFFFNFYEDIFKIIHPVSEKILTDDEKSVLNDEMQNSQKLLRLKFLDLLLAVDKQLYNEILANTDQLIDNLTEKLFDEGINLQHYPKFEEEVIERLSTSKTNSVRVLYNFNQ